jgi:hypothetical protein
MLYDGSPVVGGFSSLETPKPSFPQLLLSSLSTPNNNNNNNNMTSANHVKPTDIVDWDWDVENADRKREAKADSAVHGAPPFAIDRNVLRDVIREKMDCRVVRIQFLSSGASPPRSFFPLPK